MSSFNTFVGIYFFPLFYKPPFLFAINTKMFLLDGHYQLAMLPPRPSDVHLFRTFSIHRDNELMTTVM